MLDGGEDKLGPNSLDKERSLLNDDPKWLDTTYVLANYKTEVGSPAVPRQTAQY